MEFSLALSVLRIALFDMKFRVQRSKCYQEKKEVVTTIWIKLSSHYGPSSIVDSAHYGLLLKD
jgi:hypothetical protein